MLVFLLALILCRALAEPSGERPAHPVPEELFLRPFLAFPGAALASRQARVATGRYQLPQQATFSSLAGPGFCIYDVAAKLQPGKAEEAQGRRTAREQRGSQEQPLYEQLLSGGQLGHVDSATGAAGKGGAGGTGGAPLRDAGFSGLHPHNLDGWADEYAGATTHYMDASLRSASPSLTGSRKRRAHTDDVVMVRAGRSVRSVYDDDEQGGGDAGAGGSIPEAVTDVELTWAMGGTNRLALDYVELLRRPHTEAEAHAMEARTAASRAHFDKAPGPGALDSFQQPVAQNSAGPSAKALQSARVRDRARRPAPPVPPYDDTDYEEGDPGESGHQALLGAAALAHLDTFQQAEEEFPAWEEELFGGPAGNYTYADYADYPYEAYEYDEDTPGY
ncbi:hypothetical protein WJX81_004198 [Elliptochloris bilobata]|uniref:Uncharacterized protein n=1 Tax=Elliptochloris bilobata TaxID=381761 RepID=A0AAW1RUA7_9CHLO